MSETHPQTTPRFPRLTLVLIVLLFIASGCAALIYEVVWLQLLQLTLGSTAVSLAVLLATFMGGMCLGSLLLPRLASPRRHPLRVYALLELGIGALALVVLLGLPSVDQVYSRLAGRGAADLFLRGVVAALFLLLPAMLMGATLPAIARWVETSSRGMSWLGLCYAGNLAGAVAGCLVAGFYLLRVHDMATASYFAMAINASAGFLALGLAGKIAPPATPTESGASRPEPAPRAWAVYVVIALSGMAALGAEVVWTRLLSLILGGTVYTFSLILAVFLAGLGLGGSGGAYLARRKFSPRISLGICQMLLTAGVAWAAYMIAVVLPFKPIPLQEPVNPWHLFGIDLLRCLLTVFPPACLWGASFPLALASAARAGQDPGRVVAGVSAANTAGAIAGALSFSLLLIPMLGTAGAERVLVGLSAGAALVALVPKTTPLLRLASLAVLLGGSAVLAWRIQPIPWTVVAYGRHAATVSITPAPGIWAEDDIPIDPNDPYLYCIHVGEGKNVSVAVTQTGDGTRYFHGAGKVQASTLPIDMRLQRMLGHLPPLLHKKPRSVLVVACGAGVTAGCFVLHPDVERIVICDIEPLVPTTVTPLFGKANYHVVDGIGEHNPQRVNGKEVEVIYDDGRHFLRTTQEKFDIITSDPIDPWVKGCAALNTIEYYQACREHLNPGGSVALWMPFYESDLETTRSLIGTFFEVFPDGIVWSNDDNGQGYDAVLFGQLEPPVIDVNELQQRLERPDHQAVKESLREVGFGAPGTNGAANKETEDIVIALLATFAGDGRGLQSFLSSAQINTDRNLRLQYLAGMSVHSWLGTEILQSILGCYHFPEQTFVGSPSRLRALRVALDAAGRKPWPGRSSGE
jgi:spermidine synthase